MENYRQYKKQKINFSTNSEKNFTIIVGRNGFGKSNILNAVTWCFYGVEDHLKISSEEGGSEDFPIINIKVFDDLKNGEETHIVAKINMEVNSEDYVIKRTLRAGKHGNGDKYIDESSKLEVMFTSDGKSWDEALNPTYAINALIPKDIKQFFFFDGEKLRQHFEKDTNQKIKVAINDISQTNLLDKAIERLNYVSDQLRRDTRTYNPKTQEYYEKIERYKKLIQGAQDKLNETETTLTETKEFENKIKEELKGCNVALIEKLQKDREEFQQNKQGYEDRKVVLKERIINYLLKVAPSILLRGPISETISVIDELRKKGLVPPPIDEPYIHKILHDGFCICGTDISKGQTRKKVQSILEIAKFSRLPTQEGEIIFSGIQNESTDFISRINELRKDLIETEKMIENTEKKIKEVSAQIGKSNIERIRILEADRQRYENAIHELLKQKAEYGIMKKNYQKDLDEVQTEYDREISKENKYRDVIARKEVCDNSIKLLNQIKDKLINNIRISIQKDTETCFFDLIKEKRDTYKEVLIDSEYNIKIVHKTGFNALNTLSAGETQIFVLSFAAALRNASGFKAPLIIDTPLGKIDEEYRKEVSSILPEFLKDTQVILLVTSSEYTPEVKKNLTKRVEKNSEYRLEFNKDEEETKVNLLWK